MKILVTGATGFIGSNLALYLDSEGHEIIAVSRDDEQKLDNFKGKLITRPFYELDFNKIGKIDAVFHQAAIVGMLTRDGKVINNKKEIEFVNVEAPLLLFENAIKKECKRIVYASSTAVYGGTKEKFIEWKNENPNSIYGETKLALDKNAMELAEKHKDKGVKIIGLRYSNVYGPRENHKGKSANVIYQFAQQMLKGNPKLFKYGEQKRDEIYIKDVIRANLLALNSKQSCVVNCGKGKAVSFNEIIRTLNLVMGLNRKTEYIDNPYMFFQDFTECDMTKCKEMLGFEAAYNLKEGIKDYYKSGWLTKPSNNV